MTRTKTYAVYDVLSRNGHWWRRAYPIDGLNNPVSLPKTLKKVYVCRVPNCRYPIDAVRASRNHPPDAEET